MASTALQSSSPSTKRTEGTKSKSRNRAKDTVAAEDATATVVSNASLASTSTRGNTMSDVSSIVEFSEDISNAEWSPLPEGDYTAEIKGATRKTSQNSGNDYASVQFHIAAEQYPADYTDGDPDGVTINYNLVSLEDTPRARYNLRKFCENIGAPTGTKIDLNDWMGRAATVHVRVGEFEGQPRNDISRVVAP
jgi:hypothetical protein